MYLRDWWDEAMHPDATTAGGVRLMLWARYQHIDLKFAAPPASEKFEASWDGGGSAVADSEEELISTVLEVLQDCGSGRHDWVFVGEKPDPNNVGQILRTQKLECSSCDSRVRVITAPAPCRKKGPTEID
jgi:hypothetical protein